MGPVACAGKGPSIRARHVAGRCRHLASQAAGEAVGHRRLPDRRGALIANPPWDGPRDAGPAGGARVSRMRPCPARGEGCPGPRRSAPACVRTSPAAKEAAGPAPWGRMSHPCVLHFDLCQNKLWQIRVICMSAFGRAGSRHAGEKAQDIKRIRWSVLQGEPQFRRSWAFSRKATDKTSVRERGGVPRTRSLSAAAPTQAAT